MSVVVLSNVALGSTSQDPNAEASSAKVCIVFNYVVLSLVATFASGHRRYQASWYELDS